MIIHFNVQNEKSLSRPTGVSSAGGEAGHDEEGEHCDAEVEFSLFSAAGHNSKQVFQCLTLMLRSEVCLRREQHDKDWLQNEPAATHSAGRPTRLLPSLAAPRQRCTTATSSTSC